jgi:hypothetical protein
MIAIDVSDGAPVYAATAGIWRPAILSSVIVVPAGFRRIYLPLFTGEALPEGRDSQDNDAQISCAFRRFRHTLDALGIQPANIVKVMHIFVSYEESHLRPVFREMTSTFDSGRMPTSTGICVESLGASAARYALQAEGVVGPEYYPPPGSGDLLK